MAITMRACTTLAGVAIMICAAGALADVDSRVPAQSIVSTEPLRFVAPQGGQVTVTPGTWRVEAIGDSALRLVPERGDAVAVAARAIKHTEVLPGPFAMLTRGADNAPHIALLFPDGVGFDAVGAAGNVDVRKLPPLDAVSIKRGVVSLRAIPPTPATVALVRSGRASYELSSEWGHWRAIRYFEAALAADARNAAAHAGIADAYGLLYLHVRPQPEYMAKAKQHAMQAVTLAPTGSEGHASLGSIASNTRDLGGARRELELALQYDPRNALARQWYAGTLMSLGRVEEGLANAARAAAEEPYSAMRQGIASRLHQVARRYDEAIRFGLRARELNPDLPGFLRMSLAYSFWAKQQLPPAAETLLRDPAIPPDQKAALRALADAQGLRALVKQLFTAQAAQSGKPCTDVPSIAGTVLAFLGETSAAMDCLERSIQEGTPPAFLALDPILDPLRKDPRFVSMLARL